MLISGIELNRSPDTGTVQKLLPLLNDTQREEVLRFRKPFLRYRAILSRLLIISTIADFTGMNPDSIKIVRTGYNKPVIDGISDLYFNLSHSGKYMIIALSSSEIGVDIEQTDPDRIDHMLPHFSSVEQKHLTTISSKQKVSEVYKVWTLKESFLKAHGTGLRIDPSSFTMIPGKKTLSSQYRFYEFISGYIASLFSLSSEETLPDNFTIEKDTSLINRYIEKHKAIIYYQ